ncbi:MAG: bacteriocin [Planctomycetales bacterium 12-60-4]|nr:MAG: bacteriocin [Planctomycetales bacterium 12-60-4]
MHLFERFRLLAALAYFVTAAAQAPCMASDDPPKVGQTVADFELPALDGGTVKLSDAAKTGPVVLVVLRGFPGYQCPVCNKQVGQFLGQAEAFKAAGATVLMVYPGVKMNLKQRAEEFMTGKTLPDHFRLLVDGDYKFTNAYNLRWDAPNKTAYPSTFIIQPDMKVSFAVVSKTHGGRAQAGDVLKALSARP